MEQVHSPDNQLLRVFDHAHDLELVLLSEYSILSRTHCGPTRLQGFDSCFQLCDQGLLRRNLQIHPRQVHRVILPSLLPSLRSLVHLFELILHFALLFSIALQLLLSLDLGLRTFEFYVILASGDISMNQLPLHLLLQLQKVNSLFFDPSRKIHIQG